MYDGYLPHLAYLYILSHYYHTAELSIYYKHTRTTCHVSINVSFSFFLGGSHGMDGNKNIALPGYV